MGRKRYENSCQIRNFFGSKIEIRPKLENFTKEIAKNIDRIFGRLTKVTFKLKSPNRCISHAYGCARWNFRLLNQGF
jgi:hypothetical protein